MAKNLTEYGDAPRLIDSPVNARDPTRTAEDANIPLGWMKLAISGMKPLNVRH